jgi:hypothetical protein
MKLLDLGLMYGLLGLGCALVLLVRRSEVGGNWLDAVLLAGFWPVYGPFLLARIQGTDDGPEGSEVAFLAALRKARGTPLAALLPDQQTVTALGRRLRVATHKVQEIDAILARPEFQQREALGRLRELQERGASDCALSTASIRIQNIRRMQSLRDRFARELDEVQELLNQLRTQAEVVRIAGVADDETRDLVQELVSRVEGLDRMLDDDPHGTASEEAKRSFDARLAQSEGIRSEAGT